jgi:hypothetical protein
MNYTNIYHNSITNLRSRLLRDFPGVITKIYTTSSKKFVIIIQHKTLKIINISTHKQIYFYQFIPFHKPPKKERDHDSKQTQL